MIEYEPIGRVNSPYEEEAPFQPIPGEEAFAIELDEEYAAGLRDLETFEYAYVLYHLDRAEEYALSVTPPWIDEQSIGLFATRSPRRPNPIGLSVVRVLEIEGTRVSISAIDAFDGTPVLDVKPYVDRLDAKPDANVGWIDTEKADDAAHLELHVKGIPH